MSMYLCPHCGKEHPIDRHKTGDRVRCSCGGWFLIRDKPIALAAQPRGRRVPEQQISGRPPKILDIPPSAHKDVIALFRALEQTARDGYTQHGRGFVLVAHNADDRTLAPFIDYITPSHAFWRAFRADASIPAALQAYDPTTQLVIFEATADLEAMVFTDIQFSIWNFWNLLTLPAKGEERN